MLNFLAKAAVVAIKTQATRAVNDACQSGYNAAKKRLAQKKGGNPGRARKITTPAKARAANSAKTRTIKSKSAPRKYSSKTSYKRRK